MEIALFLENVLTWVFLNCVGLPIKEFFKLKFKSEWIGWRSLNFMKVLFYSKDVVHDTKYNTK